MSIEALAGIQALSQFQSTTGAATPPVDGSFARLVDTIGELNREMQGNDRAAQSLALGETGNLHQVMMDMEKTRLSFELLLQVRNKTLDAYQELMRMQI